MAPNQRLALIIMGSILLVGVGRLWLFTSLTTQPEEIATNIQAELDQKIGEEQQVRSGEQLGNKGTTNTGSLDTNKRLPDPFPLTILLPPRVQQEKISELLSRIDPEKKFQPTLFQPTTYTTYLRAIEAMSTGSRQADLILLPRQELSMVTSRGAKIDRSETNAPTGLFHPQIGKLLTAGASMFIPHVLDPRVTVTQAPTKNLTLGTFLQTHRSPLQFLETENNIDENMLALSDIRLNQLYGAANISLVPKLFLSTPTVPCTLQTTCLASGTSALRLPLSLLNNQTVEDLQLSIFPSINKDIPTTVRGWVARGNDTRPYVQQRLYWIQKYLTVMSADQLPYESPLLPAYFPRLQRLVLQDERSWLKGSLYDLSILQDGFTKLQKQFTLLPLSLLLDGSYRPELYLEKRQEIRKERNK